MTPLLALLVACNPHDVVLTDASYIAWLAEGSSATLADGGVARSELELLDCGANAEADDDGTYPGCPEGFSGGEDTNFAPEYYWWLAEEPFEVTQGGLEAWRAEALLTNEGDFQITIHHDLGKEDFRFAFVIDPTFEPSICVQEGQTCYTIDDPENPQDSDGDGWADYDDPDCLSTSWEIGFAGNACNNGIDDDGDGVIDGDDEGCDNAWDDAEAQRTETCRDNVDNDDDGWIDTEDPDCAEDGYDEDGRLNDLYACTNLVDDDGDGLADGGHANKQGDEGCSDALDNSESGPTNQDPCEDDHDNDGDGWIDGDDVDCDLYGEEVGITTAACNDGEDNDGDGLQDAEDPGCLIAFDANEEDMVEIEVVPEDTDTGDTAGAEDPYWVVACDDGEDNDGDGWADLEDPDCIYGIDEDNAYFGLTACNDGEVSAPADLDYECPEDPETVEDVCNGFDDDCDGEVDEDVGTDEDCDLCDLVDNDGDGDVDEDQECDAEDRDCRTGFDNLESSIPSSSCSNGLDDDGDGWSDDEDPDCVFGLAEVGFSAFSCNDAQDNDGDGGTDGGVRIGYEQVDVTGDTGIPGTVMEWVPIAGDRDAHCGVAEMWTESPSGSLATCANGTQVENEDGDLVWTSGDDDGDGWYDFEDPDCLFGYGEAGVLAETECNDGADNDGDGLVDAEDESCFAATGTHELIYDTCVDGIDNDGDGWLDELDGDCADDTVGYERGFGVGFCQDNIDNDGDGLIDAEDDGCDSTVDPFEEEFNECSDGEDNDDDGWTDANDPDCFSATPYEDNNSHYGVSACNDGVDNDNDDLIDYLDTDCDHAFDNAEEPDETGEPVPFYLGSHSVLDNWSADEEDHTIWYLNAGSYQTSPYDSQEYWTLPGEWRSGYAISKFASEEFRVEPQDFYFYGMPYDNPDYEGLAAYGEEIAAAADVYDDEPCIYGKADHALHGGTAPTDSEPGVCGFEFKVEDNSWRPVDVDGAGLDNWVELHHSYVRLKNTDGNRPNVEVGGSVSGDYQIYLTGFESASGMMIRGSFEVDDIRKDRWGYDDLEAQKYEESGREPCEY